MTAGRYRENFFIRQGPESNSHEQPTAQPLSWKDVVDEKLTFIIPDGLLIHLETWISSAAGREVSGVGIMEKDPEAKTFTLRKCWLMAAGSVAYTEIPGAKMVKLIEEGVRPDQLKVWWHRHPVGDGIPGPHNWSGTDNNTIRNEPFGIDPSMVQWLLSIVRTPRGWVGRYDNHDRKQTVHMSVGTKVSPKQYAAAADLIDHHVQAELRAATAYSRGSEQVVSLPRKQGHRYFPSPVGSLRPRHDPAHPPKTDDVDPVFQQLDLEKGAVDLVPIEGGIENMLRVINWSRNSYLTIGAELKYELPEFVAYDNAVTLAEMYKVHLLTQEEMDVVLRRIQEQVDRENPQYLLLISNWDLADL